MLSNRLLHTASTAAAGVLGAGFFAGTAFAGASTPAPTPTVHAVFIETDESGPNHILSYLRGVDGSLVLVGETATGGVGGSALKAVADPLASQGGLTLINNNTELVATNPGSNTVSVFLVSGTSLKLIQQIASGGSFPDSVATRGNLVAVLNAGGTGAVSEFKINATKLVPIAGQTRSLGLSNTTPPDFVHGAGQVGYTPDGKHLVVTTKHSTDSYEVFSVSGAGQLGATATVTAAANAVPFAFGFDPAGRLVGAEASNSSVTTYTIGADGSLTKVGTISDGGKALCWISVSGSTYYGSNAGSATVSSFSENPDGTPTLVNATAAATHPGTTDSTVSPDGKFLFVESGATGALDSFRIKADGSLKAIETLWNIPVASEGIAAN